MAVGTRKRAFGEVVVLYFVIKTPRMQYLNKCYLVLLGVSAIVLGRSVFFFFDDPEGPNLLVVGVVALGTYLLALPVYMFVRTTASIRFCFGIVAQIVILVGLYILGVTL